MMNERARSRPGRFFTVFGRWLPFMMLFAGLLTGGCATVNGQKTKSSPEVLYFPSPGGPTVIEPTVIEPTVIEPTVIEPTVVSYPEYRDPLIWMNRGIFAFNDVTYRYLLIPLGKGFTKVVPEPARDSIGNFFDNIKMPVNAVNHLLQLEPVPMGKDLLRFVINSTVGLAGLFDPADAWWEIEADPTGFDDTLAKYGAGYGFYLVLPILGPSDLRNTTSLVADHFLNPIIYLLENPERSGVQGFDAFQDYAPGAERYETLREKSEDPYIFFRNLYLQGVQRDVDY
jgi:phospholipid-binding lipoprotein MlaA